MLNKVNEIQISFNEINIHYINSLKKGNIFQNTHAILTKFYFAKSSSIHYS